MKHIFRTLLLILNLVVVAVTLLSGYGGMVNPMVTTIPAIALMIFPVMCVACVTMIVLDLLLWRRMAFVPALAVLVCAPAVWSICPLNIGHPRLPDGYKELKVMTYNVYEMQDENRPYDPEYSQTLANIIADDADIVCLQENRGGELATWREFTGQVDTLLSRYPYREGIGNGLNVYSKFPTDSIPIKQSGNETTSFQCVRVNVDGTPVILYNIHLQSLKLLSEDKKLYVDITKRPTRQRLEEARYDLLGKLTRAMKLRSGEAHLLRREIERIGGGNIIVAGDFNDIEGCYAQRVIEGKNLRSVYTAAGRGPAFTYNASRLYFNIDHVLCSNNIKPLSYKRGNIRSSDHYPVTATVGIPLNLTK